MLLSSTFVHNSPSPSLCSLSSLSPLCLFLPSSQSLSLVHISPKAEGAAGEEEKRGVLTKIKRLKRESGIKWEKASPRAEGALSEVKSEPSTFKALPGHSKELKKVNQKFHQHTEISFHFSYIHMVCNYKYVYIWLLLRVFLF